MNGSIFGGHRVRVPAEFQYRKRRSDRYRQQTVTLYRPRVLSPCDFGKALADNDLTNWQTQTTTRLIHSEQDEYIPYLTTQQTYIALCQLGSPKVSLVKLKGGHVPSEISFMTRTIDRLGQLKK